MTNSLKKQSKPRRPSTRHISVDVQRWNAALTKIGNSPVRQVTAETHIANNASVWDRAFAYDRSVAEVCAMLAEEMPDSDREQIVVVVTAALDDYKARHAADEAPTSSPGKSPTIDSAYEQRAESSSQQAHKPAGRASDLAAHEAAQPIKTAVADFANGAPGLPASDPASDGIPEQNPPTSPPRRGTTSPSSMPDKDRQEITPHAGADNLAIRREPVDRQGRGLAVKDVQGGALAPLSDPLGLRMPQQKSAAAPFERKPSERLGEAAASNADARNAAGANAYSRYRVTTDQTTDGLVDQYGERGRERGDAPPGDKPT